MLWQRWVRISDVICSSVICQVHCSLSISSSGVMSPHFLVSFQRRLSSAFVSFPLNLACDALCAIIHSTGLSVQTIGVFVRRIFLAKVVCIRNLLSSVIVFHFSFSVVLKSLVSSATNSLLLQ